MGAIVSAPESGDVEARDDKVRAQAGPGLSFLFDDHQVKKIEVSEAFAKAFADEWSGKQQLDQKNDGEARPQPKAKKSPNMWAKLSTLSRPDEARSALCVEDYACLEPSSKSLWEETGNKNRLQALLRAFAALVRAQGGLANAHANAPPRIEHLPRSSFAAPIPAAALGSKDKFVLLRAFGALESLAAALSTSAAGAGTSQQGEGRISALQASEVILDLQAETDKLVAAELLGAKAFPLFGRAALAEPIFRHPQTLAASSRGQVRSAALGLMLSVVLATGDLGSLLELAAALESGVEALPPASVRQLARLAREPGPGRCELVVPAYPPVEAFKGQAFERAAPSQEESKSSCASLCTDGAHLYVWDGTRLLKRATGLLAGVSQHGQVVAVNDTIATDVDAPYLSLALVGAKLYLRSAKQTLVLSAGSLAEEGVTSPLVPAARPTDSAAALFAEPTIHTLQCAEGQVLDVRCLPGARMAVHSAALQGPEGESLDVTASVTQLVQASGAERLYFDYSGRAAVSDMVAAAGGGAKESGGGGSAGGSEGSAAEADEHGPELSSHLCVTIAITPPPAGSVATQCAPPALTASDGRALCLLTRSLSPKTDASAGDASPYLEPQRDIRLTSAYFHEDNFGGGECLAEVQELWASFLAGTLSPVVASEAVFSTAGDKAPKKKKKEAFNHYPASLAVGDIVRRGPNWRYDAQDTQSGVRHAGVVIGLEPDNAVRVEWRSNVSDPSSKFHTNKYWFRPPRKFDIFLVNPANPEASPPDVPSPSGAVAGGSGAVAGGKVSLLSSEDSLDDEASLQVLYINILVGREELSFAFPEGTSISFDLLLEAAARQLAGLDAVLSAVVLDPETRASVTVPLQDSPLSLSSLARLEAETALLFNGRLLLVRQKAGSCTFVSYLFDLADGGLFMGSAHRHFPKAGTPAALAFDRRSNFVYAYDPATLLFQRWRNSGLPPTASLLSSSAASVHASATASSSATSATWDDVLSRGDAFESVDALLRDEQKQGSIGSPRRQAVLLHALAAQRGQDVHSSLSVRQPAAEADLRSMLVLSSRGRREDHKEVGHGISVRGVAPAVCPRTPPEDVPAGYYLCALDGANYSDVLELIMFDVASEDEGSKGEDLANFIEDQEEGVVILITTVGDASCAFSSRALAALRSIGLPAPDRLLPRKGKGKSGAWPSGVCSLACIGRKGAKAGSAPHVIADGGDLVILKARIPTLAQPLLCDPSRPVLTSLTRRCVATVDRVRRQGSHQADPCDVVELVSCLKLLAVNISSLVLGTPQEAVSGLLDAETRVTLMQLLRELIYPPLGGPGGRVVAACAMDAFFVCQSLVESAISDQLAMLSSLLKEKHASGGILSAELDVLLTLLLERLSTSAAIARLLRDDAALADANLLVRSLMDIVRDGAMKNIERLHSGAGGGGDAEESSQSAAKLLYPLLLGLASKAALLFVSPGASQRAGLGLFLNVLTDVADLTYTLVSAALECSSRVSPQIFGPALDDILQHSPARKVMPTLLLSLASLVSLHGPRTLALEPTRVVAVAELLLSGHRALLQVLALVPPSSLHRHVFVETSVPVATTVTTTVEAESEHNYAPNLNLRTQYQFKDATSIQVVFDPRTQTESGCDWLCFQSPDGSEDYSIKISGTNASEWQPFCLPPGVTAFSTLFHSDGSCELWGYKLSMTVTSSVTALEAKTVEADVKHWCLVLDEQHVLALAQLAGALIAGRPQHPVWEDCAGRPGPAATYLEDPVVSMQVACESEEEERLLVDLIERPEGSLARRLVAIMREDRALEDQGHDDETIEAVVYGTCAAALKHNNLLHEALAIAKGTRVAQVSAPFKMAWKTSQKMRQYLLQQSGTNVDKRAEAILDKIRFLLRSASGDGDEAKAEEAHAHAHAHASPTSVLRWALLRQNMKTAVKTPSLPRLGSLVSQLSVNERLQKLKRFRKRLAEKRPLSITERVLQFLKDQTVEPGQLTQLLALRTARAGTRAQGFSLCCQLLELHAAGNNSGSGGDADLSHHALCAHVCKAIRRSCTQLGKIHCCNFLQGVSATQLERVSEAHAAFLAQCFALVETLPVPSALAISCLQACAMDPGVGDLRALNRARVVPILGTLLSSPDEGISTLADSLLQLLPLPSRGGKLDGSFPELSASEDGGEHSADVKAFSASFGHVLAAKVGDMGRAAEAISTLAWPEQPLQQGVERVFDDVYSLYADTTGYSFPVETSGPISGGGRTYSCWIMRPASAVLDKKEEEVPLRVGDLVMRGVLWGLQGQVERNDEDGGLGGLGTVTALRADAKADVQWRCGGKAQTLLLVELARACESMGGHIFSQGTSALKEKEGGTTVGLVLLPDASLCAFCSSGMPTSIVTARGRSFTSPSKEGMVAPRVPPNQWVHVSLSFSPSAVCTIRVNGLVQCEEMLAVPARSETKTFESLHPYRDNTDSYTVISFPPAFKKFTVTFDPQTKTEARHDYVTFFQDASHTLRWGKEKYSGRGDSRNFPGLEEEPPLVIPSNSCEMYFHSDGSTTDWGYKVFCKAERPGHTPTFTDCNGPLHLGGLPFFAIHSAAVPALRTSMTGLVAQLRVSLEDAGWEAALPDTVDRADIHKCRVSKISSVYKGEFNCDVCHSDGFCSITKVYHCEKCGWDCHTRCMAMMLQRSDASLALQSPVGVGSSNLPVALAAPPAGPVALFAHGFQLCVLDLLSKTLDLSARVEAEDSYVTDMRRELSRVLVSNPTTSQALLHVCAGSTSPLLKGCAFKILCRLLPRLPIPMVEAQAVASSIAGPTSSLPAALLHKAGSMLLGSIGTGRYSCKRERRAEEGIEASLLSLLRALAVSAYTSSGNEVGTAWSATVGALLKDECQRAAALLEPLRDADAPMPQDLDSLAKAYGLLAFFGGALQSACTPGARALYLRQGALTEPCTVLAPAHVPAEADPPVPSDVALWKDLNSFGEAVAVCLDSSPKKQVVVPARNLRFLDLLPDDAHFADFLAESVGAEALCNLFATVVAIDVTDSRPLLGGLSSRKDCSMLLESAHPYSDNERFYKTLTLDPSVKEVVIEFDEQCATEGGCDYLVFYKDSTHSSKWDKDKYTGRKGDTCWKDPLVIPSNTFIVHFYSDGSNVDWGFGLKMSYTQRVEVAPPSFPLDPLLLPRSHLKMAGTKALRSVLQSAPWFTRALARNHALSSAMISTALRPSSCLVLERELLLKCGDSSVYLCNAVAAGCATPFAAHAEAALHSCVYAQHLLTEGLSSSVEDEDEDDGAEAAVAGGGPSQSQSQSVPQKPVHAVPRVLRLSGVLRDDGKEDTAINGFYLEDFFRSSGGLVYRKAGAAANAAGAANKKPKSSFNHYPQKLEEGDLVRRGPNWSYGDQDTSGGVRCLGVAYLVAAEVVSVHWVADLADRDNFFHDNNYYWRMPGKLDLYRVNPADLEAYPPGECPPVEPVEAAVAGGRASVPVSVSNDAPSDDEPSVVIALVTGASEGKVNGTYHWNASASHYEKPDRTMIIEYRAPLKKWQIKSFGKKGQNAAFASLEADSDSPALWESKAHLLVAKGDEWIPQKQATVSRGPSSPGAARYLEFVVTDASTGAGRWVLSQASQLGSVAGRLFCEASSAALPMDPACCWSLRTRDDPAAPSDRLKGVRAVSMAFPVESRLARGDFLAPLDDDELEASAALANADMDADADALVAAHVTKTDRIPTSFVLSGATGALAEANGVWDLVPPHDARRSEPRQHVLQNRAQTLTVVYCPAVSKQQGCGPECGESHSSSLCLVCGENWGTHSGHNCSNSRGRGSFPSSASVVKDPQSRRFQLMRQGSEKPLAFLPCDAVLDKEGRLRSAGPGDAAAAAVAAAVVPDKPPLNRAGVLMKPGSGNSNWQGNDCSQLFYCGRHLGRDVIQDSDGTCGPRNGPPCPDCRGLTPSTPPEGVTPIKVPGPRASADKLTDERLEELLTDAWLVLFCPALFSSNQWRQCVYPNGGGEPVQEPMTLSLLPIESAGGAPSPPRAARFDPTYTHPVHAVVDSDQAAGSDESDVSIMSKLQAHAREPEALLSYLTARASENLLFECVLHVLENWPKDETPSVDFFGGLGRLLQLMEDLLRPEEGKGTGTGTVTGSVMALFRQLCAQDASLIGRVLEGCSASLRASSKSKASDAEPWATDNIRVYETQHPLPAGTRVSLPIDIPNAQVFTVAFDPRSQLSFGDAFVARPGPGSRIMGDGANDASDLPIELSMPSRDHLWEVALSASAFNQGDACQAGDVVGTVVQCEQLRGRLMVVPAYVRGESSITMRTPQPEGSRFTLDDVLLEVQEAGESGALHKLALKDFLAPTPVPPAVCIEGSSCVLEFTTTEGSWGFSCVTRVQETKSGPRAELASQRLVLSVRLLDCLFKDKELSKLPALYTSSLFDAVLKAYVSSPEAIACGMCDLLVTITRAILHAPTSALAAMPPAVLTTLRAVRARTLGSLPSRQAGEAGDYKPDTQAQAQLVIYLAEALAALESAQTAETRQQIDAEAAAATDAVAAAAAEAVELLEEEGAAAQPSWLPHLEFCADVMRASATHLLPESVMTSRFLPLCSANSRVVVENRAEKVSIDSAEGLLVVLRSLALEGEGSVEVLDGAGNTLSVLAAPVPTKKVRARAIAAFLSSSRAAGAGAGAVGAGDLLGDLPDGIVHVYGPSLTIRTRPGGSFKLEVIPRFALGTARALTQFQPLMDALKLEFCGSPGSDAALVRYVNAQAEIRGWFLPRLLQAKWSELAPADDSDDLLALPKLKALVQSSPNLAGLYFQPGDRGDEGLANTPTSTDAAASISGGPTAAAARCASEEGGTMMRVCGASPMNVREGQSLESRVLRVVPVGGLIEVLPATLSPIGASRGVEITRVQVAGGGWVTWRCDYEDAAGSRSEILLEEMPEPPPVETPTRGAAAGGGSSLSLSAKTAGDKAVADKDDEGDDDLFFASFEQPAAEPAQALAALALVQAGGSSAGGGATPGPRQSKHVGEWRNGEGQYHCALDEESQEGSKFLCMHGSCIQGTHWSCCGAREESAAGCGAGGEEGEDGESESPAPAGALAKTAGSLPLLLRCVGEEICQVLSGPREAPLDEWGGAPGVLPGNVVEARQTSRVVVEGSEFMQLFDGSGWVAVSTPDEGRLFDEVSGADAPPRELPEVITSDLHEHPLRRVLHRSFGCDGKDSPFGCRSGVPGDASRFPFSYCLSFQCRECDFDLCYGCAVESAGVQAPVIFQSQHHPHVLTKKRPTFYKGGKYGCDLLSKGLCVCGEGDKKVRFQGFTWNCSTCKYDHCTECIHKEFSEQRAAQASGNGGGAALRDRLSLSRTRPAASAAEARFNILLRLNASLIEALPLVNLTLCDPSTGAGAQGHGGAASLPLARLLSTSRELLFSGLRDPIWAKALAATEVPSDSKFNLQLSRSRAAKYAALGAPDTGGRWTVFSQAFRQLQPMPPRSLRRGNQIYKVLFMGEHSIDAGGPYRESFGMYWQELQSPALSLLIKCPNALETNGTDRDCWRLNPSANSAVELEMFSFLGKLLGMAIRGKAYAPLAMPPLMWKLLIGETPTIEDLKGVDLNKIKSMLEVRNIESKEGVTAENFADIFPDLFFSTIAPDGSGEVEVVPGGFQRAVTFHNRAEYVDALIKYKLHEYDAQVKAVRAGLATIVPLHTLSLLTHDIFERLVCGNPEVDLALLKRCCDYDGCRPEDPHIVMFWQALGDFSQEERSMFLRFVWGRARLPLSEADFTQRFKIANFRRSPADSFLPASHTCFFTLDLPTYSSVEIIAKRIRYAIYNCQEVDGDDGGSGVEIASMGWEE